MHKEFSSESKNSTLLSVDLGKAFSVYQEKNKVGISGWVACYHSCKLMKVQVWFTRNPVG